VSTVYAFLRHITYITLPPQEDRATGIGNIHKKLGRPKTGRVVPEMLADRQTYRQTNALTAVLGCSAGQSRLITRSSVSAERLYGAVSMTDRRTKF